MTPKIVLIELDRIMLSPVFSQPPVFERAVIPSIVRLSQAGMDVAVLSKLDSTPESKKLSSGFLNF